MPKQLVRNAVELTLWLVALTAIGWLLGTVVVAFLRPLDEFVFKTISGWPASLRSIMQLITHLGDFEFLAVVAVIVSLALLRRWPNHALYVFATFGGSVVLAQLVKTLVGRARPPGWVLLHGADSPSFVSGHAVQSLALYGAIALVVTRITKGRTATAAEVIALVLVFAIGLSRVVIGAHYPLDVIFGWVLGGAWLGAATRTFERRAVSWTRKPPRGSTRSWTKR